MTDADAAAGEVLDFQPTEPAEEDETTPLTYEIASYPADYTLKVFYDKWQSGQLVIPEFQRNYIWTRTQASRLIESFLLGLPVPGVFLYKESSSQRLLVVDGQQRLATVRHFYDGTFKDGTTFRLTAVAERWEGKTYAELSQADRYRFDDAILRATVMQQLNPQDNSSVYLLFERLNSGGTQLNPMEIRKCLFSGEAFSLLEELNGNEEWRELIGRPRVDSRYRDIELVLRVLAMARTSGSYEKPMKVFLTNYMRTLAESEDERTRARRAFSRACIYAYEELPERPFHVRTRVNLAALDSILGTLTRYPRTKRADLGKRYDKLIKDVEYDFAITQDTSDVTSVLNRFRRARAILLD